ncbi:MAG: YfhO family protein [Deltaproteobacteria bacterium]|nr:YfhO family protein [Myxococcales bacterium]MDP3213551.1 YfhO family protein [Deltaproteobacteria bacterium]
MAPDGAAAWARDRWAALVVAAAVAWQYRAPLTGRVWYFEDIAAYFVPLHTAAAKAMRAGGLAVWEPGAWSGQPVIADPQVGCFYPLHWLWLAVQPVTLYAWLALAHTAFGAVGMWALARARGRSHVAAALAALTLALGAFFVLQVRHAPFTSTTAWVVWGLWAVERYGQSGRPRYALGLSLAGALALLAGGWSMLPFAAAVGAVLASASLARAPGHRVSRALGLAGAGALAVALAAAQIVPAMAHVPESPRALGLGGELASSYAWPSWRYALTLVLPTLYGDEARGTWVGAPNQWELSGYGVGLVATLLALAAVGARARRAEALALLALTLAACDVARGDGGVLHPLLHRLPVLGSLRCPARALYVWVLIAPILAADGLDLVARAAARRGRWAAWAPVALVVAAACELLVTWRSENPSVARAAATRAPDAVVWLRAQPEPGRVASDLRLPRRFHNAGLAWGLEGAGGYHSLPVWRYLHLLWIANTRRPYPGPPLTHDLGSHGPWRYTSPIVDLLGVRWVIAPREHTIRARGFERVFRGADGADVWRNPDAFPRAFMVFRARRVHGESEAARAVADPAWDPARVAIVEGPTPGVPPPDLAAPPPAPVQRARRTSATTFEVSLQLDAPGVLVVTEPWYPGWRARVDGHPAELLRVDLALRGVALGAGAHTVRMEFDPAPLRAGMKISGAAIVLAALLAALLRRSATRALVAAAR